MRAQFVPTPIPGLSGVTGSAMAWGDYDNDGRLDFLISGSLETSLWQNTVNGFSNVTATVAPGLPGLYDGAVAWGDYDNDGRLDLLISGLTNFSGGAVAQVWRNTGSQFTNVPIPGLAGVGESSVVWCDFDCDGRLDFLISGTSNGVSSGAIAQWWRNTGAGFTNVPIPDLPGAYFGSIACADFDNDGFPDFLITGITNSSTGRSMSELWRNTGGGFTNLPVPGLRGIFSSSVAWGDYDNDGRTDFLLEGLTGNTFVSELWRNTETGFTNVPVPGLPGIADGSLAWADYDSDGLLDFLITGLTNGATEVSQLWRNFGSGFTNVPIPNVPGSFDNSLAWADYDNDGRPDFLIAGTIQAGIGLPLWENDAGAFNTPPNAPTGLTSAANGNAVQLNWNAASDDQTPATGLTYNLRIGTAPGGVDVLSPEADPDTGWRRVATMGNLGENLSATLRLAPGTYYWSVQAVDSGFAGSPFAAEQQFVVGILLSGVRHDDGSFELKFTARPGASFIALAACSASISTSNWVVLGPATEISPGEFRFMDFAASNQTERFYRVLSP